jgi:hypothetical protein
MDVCKDLDEYTKVMQQHKRVLQNARKRQGQRPHDRKDRDLMLFEFMMASISTAQRTGSEDVGTEKRREKVVVLRELQRAIIYTRELSKQVTEGHVSRAFTVYSVK